MDGDDVERAKNGVETNEAPGGKIEVMNSSNIGKQAPETNGCQ